jgi:N-ethylmaleimide reductase
MRANHLYTLILIFPIFIACLLFYLFKMQKDFPLLESTKFGPYTLKNKVVMAAMTRTRADPKDGVPTDLFVQYYSERAADAGLVLTEASCTSQKANSFPGCGCIYTDEQVEGWKKVTEAVHKVNGIIYLQICHGGRTAYNKLTGMTPVGPSPIAVRSKRGEEIEYGDVPEELTEDGIKEIIEEFRKGAENAKKAGFDGIQLHAANGYLADEFLRDATNKRTDKYGGSAENRCRFVLEVMDALISIFGVDRVGIKVSPVGRYNDMYDSDPLATYSHLLSELQKKNVSFVELTTSPGEIHLYEKNAADQIADVFKAFRPHFKNILIANNGLDWEKGNQLLKDGVADLISYGKMYLANPDLVERLKNGWELAQPDWSTVFTGGEKGYIYPKYKQ